MSKVLEITVKCGKTFKTANLILQMQNIHFLMVAYTQQIGKDSSYNYCKLGLLI